MKLRVFLSALLSIVMVTSMVACGSGGSADNNAATTPPAEANAPAEAPAAETPVDEDTSGSVVAENPELTNLDLDGTLQPGMYEGKHIVIASGSGDFEYSLKEYAKLFKELTGGEVEIQSFPDQLFEKAQLGLSSGGQFDIVVVPIAFIHSFAHAGYMSDLTDMINTLASPSFDKADFIPGLYNTYASYNGKNVALPFKPDSQMLFYRKDLFEDPAMKDAFKAKYGRDLTVPKTPEEMLEAAEFFTKSSNPDSPTEYGYSTMMSKGSSRFGWFNRLGYYGGKEVGGNYQPGFTNGSGEKALQFLMDISKFAPSDWLNFDWDLANTFFAQGNAAMMEQWPGLYLTCDQDGSPTKGKVGYAVVPGSSPTLGGWAMGIVADSKEQEMAFKFCEMVTSKDGEILKIKYTMDPCRTSNYDRDIVKELISDPDFYTALMENLSVASQLADTDIPYISAQIGDIQEAAVQAALAGEITAAQAVDQMATEFQAVVDGVKDSL